MEFELADISNYADSNIMYIIVACLTVDVIALFLARFYKVGGKYLNEWYDQFGITAVVADVGALLLGFIIARYLYTEFLFEKFGWNVIYFILVLIAVQVIHDIIFYFTVIKNLPEGFNDLIDMFRKYVDNLGGQILVGDASLMVASAILSMVFVNIPSSMFLAIGAIITYLLPYALYTRNPFNVVVKEEKIEKKKE